MCALPPVSNLKMIHAFDWHHVSNSNQYRCATVLLWENSSWIVWWWVARPLEDWLYIQEMCPVVCIHYVLWYRKQWGCFLTLQWKLPLKVFFYLPTDKGTALETQFAAWDSGHRAMIYSHGLEVKHNVTRSTRHKGCFHQAQNGLHDFILLQFLSRNSVKSPWP